MKSALWGVCVGFVVSLPFLVTVSYVGDAIAKKNQLDDRLTQIEHTIGIDR